MTRPAEIDAVAKEMITSSLRHPVELLANDPYNPTLCAGEVISTGTWTLAMPIKPRGRWTTTVAGIPLEATTPRFV
jgi:2-oxo-3-hexenedioate decarboxylase